MRAILLGAAVLGVFALPATAQEASPYRGFAFARQLCSDCHAVRAGEMVSPASEAPPFAAVMKTSGMTHMALKAWLYSSHPTMPNIILKPEIADDIIIYILTLREKPAD